MLENTQSHLQNQDGDDNFQRQLQPAAALLGQLGTTLEIKYIPGWIRPWMSIVTRCALLQLMSLRCLLRIDGKEIQEGCGGTELSHNHSYQSDCDHSFSSAKKNYQKYSGND